MSKVAFLAATERAASDFHRGLMTLDDYLLRIKELALIHIIDEGWRL